MVLPEHIQQQIEAELNASVTDVQQVSGGSINRAARLEVASAGSCFLKWNRSADPDLFVKEVKGLKLLSKADTGIRIPEVLLSGSTGEGVGFLLMEYIEEGRAGRESDADFGSRLAGLHSRHTGQFGLDHDNYIGKLPQSNSGYDSWTPFFIHQRMEPQLKMAVDSGRLPPAITGTFESMYRRLPEIFPEARPSLLHGDLWGGNYFYDRRGTAVFYDPAVYYGHPEIEIAFTHLFGGFSAGFYEAYENAHPLDPGFDSRKDVYNLYPLLVHTNLFGGTYARRVESIVNRFK